MRTSLESIIWAVVWAILVTVLGSFFTDLGPWYAALAKPSWHPPEWIFGPVWSLVFLLSAVAAVTAANASLADRGTRRQLVAVYAINGVLNILWTFLFFHSRRPEWALIEIPLLLLSVAAMIWVTSRASRAAGWLLAPYLGWVSFTGTLNWAIASAN